jgi:hypothetical protein
MAMRPLIRICPKVTKQGAPSPISKQHISSLHPFGIGLGSRKRQVNLWLRVTSGIRAGMGVGAGHVEVPAKEARVASLTVGLRGGW